jgi:hypothetical protein
VVVVVVYIYMTTNRDDDTMKIFKNIYGEHKKERRFLQVVQTRMKNAVIILIELKATTKEVQ